METTSQRFIRLFPKTTLILAFVQSLSIWLGFIGAVILSICKIFGVQSTLHISWFWVPALFPGGFIALIICCFALGLIYGEIWGDYIKNN